MAWLFVALAALVIVVIALVAVGKVSAELAQRPQLSVFDLDEAVEYVADRLPADTAGQLSYDDVRAVLDWHLAYFEARGVADEQNPLALLQAVDGAGPVVTDDDGSVAYVLGQASAAGLEISDVQVVQVLDRQMDYLRAIGAIGGEAELPADPSPDPAPDRSSEPPG